MGQPSSEQFAQRAFDLNLLDHRQVESAWSEFGTRNVPIDDFRKLLVRRELMTSFQVDKLSRGEKKGFFYGEYKVLYIVGTGTFARVYRAVHRETGEIVAVKVLRLRFSQVPAETEQFLREGEMGTKLRHENIVPIYDVNSSGNSHYIVMEFIEGHSLLDFVRIRKKISPADALPLVQDVTAGLAYAFDEGMTHRDMKMSNVLVSSVGRAKLVDFGLATPRPLTEDIIADHPNPRSIDYASLERATGVRRGDSRSDIYFVGCILYHMLTGEAPLYETKDRIQRLSITRFQEITPLGELAPETPKSVMLLVNKAMELTPEHRFQTPMEMYYDIKLLRKRLESGENEPIEQADEKKGQDSGIGSAIYLAKSRSTLGTIMVIEANPDLQNIFREKLKKQGYRVLVFGDMKRAVDRFRNNNSVADCVVFSTNRIGEDAIDAFNRFGAFERTKNIPSILLLAEDQKDWAEKANEAPHRAVISLPIRMKEFRSTISKVLKAMPE